jgi:hypothetical protein
MEAEATPPSLTRQVRRTKVRAGTDRHARRLPGRLGAIGFLARFIQRKGGFPADVRSELQRERLILLAEGIPGTISRGAASGRHGGPRRLPTLAAVALTQQRLMLHAAGEPLIDVTWDSGDARLLDLAARDDGLQVGFDAEHLAEDRSGRVEVFLRIGDAAALLAAIDQRRRPLEPRSYRQESP